MLSEDLLSISDTFVAGAMIFIFSKYEAFVDEQYIARQWDKFVTWYFERVWFRLLSILIGLSMLTILPSLWFSPVATEYKIIQTCLYLPLTFGYSYMVWNGKTVVGYFTKKK